MPPFFGTSDQRSDLIAYLRTLRLPSRPQPQQAVAQKRGHRRLPHIALKHPEPERFLRTLCYRCLDDALSRGC
jgi:hypothetical protein